MQKPSSVVADELKQSIIGLCSNCELPAFVISLVVENLAKDIRAISEEELEKERKDWIEFCESGQKEADVDAEN